MTRLLALAALVLACLLSLGATGHDRLQVVHVKRARVSPPKDWHALAVKRLRGWNRANHKLVHLRAVIRARASRSVFDGLLCIHHYEGAWTSATGNGYYGGLQMDRGFMSTYGRPLLSLGYANNWPPEAQLAVGVIAFYSGRGYGPWPNTRKDCGL